MDWTENSADFVWHCMKIESANTESKLSQKVKYLFTVSPKICTKRFFCPKWPVFQKPGDFVFLQISTLLTKSWTLSPTKATPVRVCVFVWPVQEPWHPTVTLVATAPRTKIVLSILPIQDEKMRFTRNVFYWHQQWSYLLMTCFKMQQVIKIWGLRTFPKKIQQGEGCN